MSELKVGVTSVGTFSSCRRRWWFERHWHTGKASKPMFLGSIVHAYLDGFYQYVYDNGVQATLDCMQKAYEAGVAFGFAEINVQLYDEHQKLLEQYPPDEVYELYDLGRDIYKHYVFNGNPIFFKEVLATEKFIEYTDPVTNVTIRGRVDLLVEMHDDTIAVVDHKVRGRSSEAIHTALTIDNQVNVYAWMTEVSMNIPPITSIVHNVLYNRVPQAPRLISKGKAVSKAQSVLDATSYELYKETLDDLNLDPIDYESYADVLADLYERDESGDPNPRYFERIQVEVSPAVQENLVEELKRKFKFMRQVMDEPEIYAYRNNTVFNCRFCPFLDVCYADLMDIPSELLLSTHFTRVTHTEALEDVEEDN